MQTINIEDIQVGHRYVNVISPEFSPNWEVVEVTEHYAQLQVMRTVGIGTPHRIDSLISASDTEALAWITPRLVTIRYRNGQEITEEYGTPMAVDTDELVGLAV